MAVLQPLTPFRYAMPNIIHSNDTQVPPRYYDDPTLIFANAAATDLFVASVDCVAVTANAALNNPGGFQSRLGASLLRLNRALCYVGTIYGIAPGFATPITSADVGAPNGVKSAIEDLRRVALLEAASGVKVTYWAMDNPYHRIAANGDNTGVGGMDMTRAQCVAAWVAYVQAIHAYRPSIRILGDEDMRCPWAGVTGYSSLAYPASQVEDLDLFLTALDTGLAAVGESLWGWTHDSLNEYGLGLVPSVPAVTAVDWPGRLNAIHAYFKTHPRLGGAHFGMFVNSYWGGNPATDPDHATLPASNAEAHRRSTAAWDTYRAYLGTIGGASAGIPSGLLAVASWFYYPRTPGSWPAAPPPNGDQMITPATTARTFADTQRRILHRYVRHAA